MGRDLHLGRAFMTGMVDVLPELIWWTACPAIVPTYSVSTAKSRRRLMLHPALLSVGMVTVETVGQRQAQGLHMAKVCALRCGRPHYYVGLSEVPGVLFPIYLGLIWGATASSA